MEISYDYDIIIIGGGISGIYTAYQINKLHPKKKVLLIEKDSYLGGRVYTYHDKHIQVEAGAGRFSNDHSLLLQLIDDLHLSKHVYPTSGAVYFPTGQAVAGAGAGAGAGQAVAGAGDWTTGFQKILVASRSESKQTLIHHSLLSYARTILDEKEIQTILDSFGYYSELTIMNAYDAIRLIQVLRKSKSFSFLKGGLSQIINQMVEVLRKNPNITLWTRKEVVQLVSMGYNNGFRVRLRRSSSGKTKKKHTGDRDIEYTCHSCVCALPRQCLEKLAIFKPVSGLLQSVEYGSLCRIYCQFAGDKDGKQWFQDLPKITTNNRLRMMIPINTEKGIIMFSYTDNKYADYWKKLYDKKGYRGVVREHRILGEQTTGIPIPMPIYTKMFYWKYGVGYWAIGADSADVSKRMIRPFSDQNLFVCGENYSEKYQQWIEGALDTSRQVVALL